MENYQQTITVSICMVTYNHEPYIRQAVEGVLMQQTNFEYNLIIANDCSTDRTDEVVREILSTHPKRNLIKYTNNDKNKGMMLNGMCAWKECNSKYIAFCDGDDYWTDSYKLQKQVDFLEVNTEYNVCCHSVIDLYETGEMHIPKIDLHTFKSNYSFEDLVDSNFIYSVSVIYRNTVVKELPGWFLDSPVGDYVLHLLHAHNSKIAYLPDIMAVYRRNKGGVWSSQNGSYKVLRFKWLIDKLDEYFDFKYHNRFYSKYFLDNYFRSQLFINRENRELLLYLKLWLKYTTYNKIVKNSFGYYYLLLKQYFKSKKELQSNHKISTQNGFKNI